MKKKNITYILSDYAVYFFLAIFIIINMIITPNFANTRVIWILLRQMAALVVVSMGMNIVVASGNIDISVGSVMALASVIVAYVYRESDSLFLALLIGILASLLAGAINGYIVYRWKIQAMIATIATQMIFRGIALLVNSQIIYVSGDIVEFLGIGNIVGKIPSQIIPITIFVFITWFILKKTMFGKMTEAVGNNAIAARIAGISIGKITMAGYMCCSLFAGIGGIMELFRTGANDSAATGLQYEIFAMASVAIGGSSMAGGNSNILGTVAGVAIMTLITMSANMNDIPYAYTNIIKCIIIIVAIYVQRKKKR